MPIISMFYTGPLPIYSTAKRIYGYSIEYLASDAEALSNGNGLITNESMTQEERDAIGRQRNAIAHAHGSADLIQTYRSWVVEMAGNAKEIISPPGTDTERRDS